VSFAVASGEGSVEFGSVLSDGSGFAVNWWTLGRSTADSQIVEAFIGGGAAAVRFVAKAVPDSPAIVLAVPAAVTFSAVGDSASVKVSVLDRYGNPGAGEPEVAVAGDAVLVLNTYTLFARRAGNALITYRSGEGADSVEVTVDPIPAFLAFAREADTLNAVGAERAVALEVLDRNGFPINASGVTLTSLNTSIVDVDPIRRVLLARGPGATFVVAVAGNVSDSLLVEVRQVPARVDILADREVLFAADSLPLFAVVRDSAGTEILGVQPTWGSSADSIAYVSPAGMVTGRFAGTVTITATVNGASGARSLTVLPKPLPLWTRERGFLPIISSPATNPNDISQYVPAPVLLPDGSVWLYVKGDGARDIWAYSSTDSGRTFTLRGALGMRGASGSWDAEAAWDPVAAYEPATNTIHLYYKGNNDSQLNAAWSIGHAVASAIDPMSFTKDDSNPILGPAETGAALGLEDVIDLGLADVVVIAGRFLYYGHVMTRTTTVLWVGEGSDWSNISPLTVIARPRPGQTVVQNPTVFRHPHGTSLVMVYGEGGLYDFETSEPLLRYLAVAESVDGLQWSVLDDPLLTPDPIRWDFARVYTAAVLKAPTLERLTAAQVGGSYRLYYSGSGTTGDATGLLLLRP
jgi:hypothetical protein